MTLKNEDFDWDKLALGVDLNDVSIDNFPFYIIPDIDKDKETDKDNIDVVDLEDLFDFDVIIPNNIKYLIYIFSIIIIFIVYKKKNFLWYYIKQFFYSYILLSIMALSSTP